MPRMTTLGGFANRLDAPAERTDLFAANRHAEVALDEQRRSESERAIHAVEESIRPFLPATLSEARSADRTPEVGHDHKQSLNELEQQFLLDFLDRLRKDRRATEARIRKALLHLEAETIANAIQCATEKRKRFTKASELTRYGWPLARLQKKLRKVAERQGMAFKKAIRLLDRLSIDLLSFRLDPDSRSARRFTSKSSMVANVKIFRESEVPTFTSLRFWQDDLFFCREIGSRKGIWSMQDPLRTVNQTPTLCRNLPDVRDFCFVKEKGCVIVLLTEQRARGKKAEYRAELLTYDSKMAQKFAHIKLRSNVGENERFSVVGCKTGSILLVDHMLGLLKTYSSFQTLAETNRVSLQPGIHGFDWKSECDFGVLTYADRAFILNSHFWPRRRIAKPAIDSSFEHCVISKYSFCLIEEQCRLPVKLTVIRTFSFSGAQLRTIRWPQNNSWNWNAIETLITTRESLRGWTLVDKDDGFFIMFETYSTTWAGVDLKYVRMQTQSRRHRIEIGRAAESQKKQKRWKRKRKAALEKKEERTWRWTENCNDPIAIVDCFYVPNSEPASSTVAFAESDDKLFLLNAATNCIMVAEKGPQRDAADMNKLCTAPFGHQNLEHITGMCMLKKRSLIVILNNCMIRTYPDVELPQKYYTNRVSSATSHLRDEHAFAFTTQDGRLFVAVRQSERLLELHRFNEMHWNVQRVHKLTSAVSLRLRCFHHDDRVGKFLIVCVNEKKLTYRAMVLDSNLDEEYSLPLSPNRNEPQWVDPLVGLLSDSRCLLSFRVPGEGCRTVIYDLLKRAACCVRVPAEIVSAYVPHLPAGKRDDSLTLIFCGFANSISGQLCL